MLNWMAFVLPMPLLYIGNIAYNDGDMTLLKNKLQR